MRIVVYQAVMGGRDDLHLPPFIPDGVHHFFIMGQGGVMDAKRMKILPHKYFREYDVSVWMDGNFQLIGNIKDVVDDFMCKADIAVLRHPAEQLGITPTVYKEAEVAILQKVDNAKTIRRQMEHYHKQGLPENTEVTMNGIIIRKHNIDRIKMFDDIWWQELNTWSKRDQISFPYLAWKYHLKYAKLNNVGFEADWFIYRPHTKARTDA
jgi:hypothetical protein